MASTTMRAVVRTQAGEPSVLKLDSSYPKPEPKSGHVIIRIKAIGLNRAELRSRNGDPPAKPEFTSDDLYTTEPPKILGEECVGIVEDNGDSDTLKNSDTCAVYFSGIGKKIDGAYAEYTQVQDRYVYKIDTKLPWEVLGAIPSTFMTAWGSLHRALHIRENDTLLVHGGTSSIGTAAIMLGKLAGCKVAATTRQDQKADTLRKYGADVVLVEKEDQPLAEQLKRHWEDGADHTLELVGPDQLATAFACTKHFGTVCVTGVLSKVWSIENFAPAEGIETGKKLTTYQSARDANIKSPGPQLQKIVEMAEEGKLDVKSGIGEVYHGLESLEEAHDAMEKNQVSGKVIIVLD